MLGFIGYENLFLNGTLSATSEATGFEKENAIDWLTNDWWKPSAGGTYYITVDLGSADSADYLGIAGHNLGTESATVSVEYSSDNFSGDINDAFTPVALTSDAVYVKSFSTQSARYWRLKVASTNAALIGQVSIGAQMAITEQPDVGFSPPNFSPDDKIINSKSEGGQFIGRSVVSLGVEFSIPFMFLDPAWVRTTWEDFTTHGKRYPFFYVWDLTNFPDEVVYCWSEGSWPKAEYSHTNLMSVTLSVRGIG